MKPGKLNIEALQAKFEASKHDQPPAGNLVKEKPQTQGSPHQNSLVSPINQVRNLIDNISRGSGNDGANEMTRVDTKSPETHKGKLPLKPPKPFKPPKQLPVVSDEQVNVKDNAQETSIDSNSPDRDIKESRADVKEITKTFKLNTDKHQLPIKLPFDEDIPEIPKKNSMSVYEKHNSNDSNITTSDNKNYVS